MTTYRDAHEATDFAFSYLEGLIEALDTVVDGHGLLSGNHPRTTAIYSLIDGMRQKVREIEARRDAEWSILRDAELLNTPATPAATKDEVEA